MEYEDQPIKLGELRGSGSQRSAQTIETRPSVQSELAAAERMAEEIDACVSELEKRLGAVLLSSAPMPGEGGKTASEREHMSPVAERVRNIRVNMAVTLGRLNDIAHRVNL